MFIFCTNLILVQIDSIDGSPVLVMERGSVETFEGVLLNVSLRTMSFKDWRLYNIESPILREKYRVPQVSLV